MENNMPTNKDFLDKLRERSHTKAHLIKKASHQSWEFGQAGLQISSLPEFVSNIRSHTEHPAICIAAHIGTSKGVQSETKEILKKHVLSPLDAEILRIEGEIHCVNQKTPEDQWIDKEELKKELISLQEEREARSRGDEIHLPILKLIGECGFDALQVSQKGDERHYRRLHRFREGVGRAVPIVCSDAHTVQNVFYCGNNSEENYEPQNNPEFTDTENFTHHIPYLKLSGISKSLSPNPA